MLSLNYSDPTYIGHTYWSVGEFKTISKILALEKAGGDFNQVKFHWMDETWDNIDMTKEPTESWEHLLCARAWQLRDKYAHVALLYSGGWDSHTVLMSFVKNSVPLDEIVIWDRTSHVDDVELSDAYKTAAKIVKDYNLSTKISVYEITWDYHAKIYKEFGKNYIYLPGCQLCFNQTTRLVQHEAQEEFLTLKKQHKEGTACYIEAHDKPRVTLWQNRWYQFYIDAAMYVYVGKGNSEMFYFTPSMPKLHLKQLYMSIRYFEYKLNSLPGATNDLIHQIQSFQRPDLYAEWNVAIGRECGPNYSAQHGLAKDNVLANPKKVELLNLLHHTKEYISDIYKIYNDGLQTVKEITGIDVVSGEMPGIMSKQYYIKDFSRPL
jgi:hypothetical protein